MANLITTPVDVAKRFLELEAQIKRLEEKNQRLGARNLVLEEVCCGQRRSLDEMAETIFTLEEERDAMVGAEGRLRMQYERMSESCRKAREDLDCGQRKWKMEIDLERAEVERMRGLVEEMAREKRRIEEELRDRVLRLEEAVSEWVEVDQDPKDYGLKSVGKFLILPKMESLEEEIQVGHDRKTLDCKDLGIEKGVSTHKSLDGEDLGIEQGVSAQKSTDPCTIDISDDEEEEKISSCNELKTKVASLEDSSGVIAKHGTKAMTDAIHEGTKGAPPSFAPPSAGREIVSVPHKRKSEAVTRSAERRSEAKRSKCDGPKDGGPWNTDDQMCNAFNTNDELCMEAVCALYRKHKFLGAWKYHWNREAVYVAGLEKSAVILGESLTGGDLEGRMKKSLADLEQENSRGVEHCRFIAKIHSKLLFEIYSSHQDPLFKP